MRIEEDRIIIERARGRSAGGEVYAVIAAAEDAIARRAGGVLGDGVCVVPGGGRVVPLRIFAPEG